jgi:hypothetical protein
MKQYSLKGLDTLIEVNEDREIYDKCNWLITYLFRKQMLDEKNKDKPDNFFINISSDILIQYLGSRDYRKIIELLISKNILVSNDRYSAGRFSKSYTFTEKALEGDRIEVEIQSPEFIKKLTKIQEKEYKRALETPLFKRIIENTSQLKIVEEEGYYKENLFKATDEEKENDIDPEERLKENIHQYYRYDSFYNEFKNLSNDTSVENLFQSRIYQSPIIADSGRVYHTIAATPRYIRHSMRHIKGDYLWEVDMSAAQPSLLILSWLITEEIKNAETELLLKLILKGDLYEYVKTHSKYFGSLEYYIRKKEILQALYEEYTSTIRNKSLYELFPSFMGWINSIKEKEGYKRVSYIGQSQEAKIFVEVYKELPEEMFGLIIHDSIMCLERDTAQIKNKLVERTKEIFPILQEYDLSSLFKTSIVSIIDDELMQAQNERLLRAFIENQNRI